MYIALVPGQGQSLDTPTGIDYKIASGHSVPPNSNAKSPMVIKTPTTVNDPDRRYWIL